MLISRSCFLQMDRSLASFQTGSHLLVIFPKIVNQFRAQYFLVGLVDQDRLCLEYLGAYRAKNESPTPVGLMYRTRLSRPMICLYSQRVVCVELAYIEHVGRSRRSG